MPKYWYDVNLNKRHLLTTIEDEGQTLIVSKWYNKNKQRWNYEIETTQRPIVTGKHRTSI